MSTAASICFVPGCQSPCLVHGMCDGHWRMLPVVLQRAIWASRSDKHVRHTPMWLAAKRASIETVLRRQRAVAS